MIPGSPLAAAKTIHTPKATNPTEIAYETTVSVFRFVVRVTKRFLRRIYSFPVFSSNVTPDYQLILNRAYNRDLGPVSVLGFRLNTQ
jgi:hypothetical protein